MELRLYQVDAFADKIFQGNPAAVFILETSLSDKLMQSIAAEMNLSETVFVIPKGSDYSIRWFTPSHEIELCGHATLAAAHVLWEHYNAEPHQLRFHSLSGWLSTERSATDITLDFPANPAQPIVMPEGVLSLFGEQPSEALANDNLMLVYSDAKKLQALSPDFSAIARLPYSGVLVTAPGTAGEGELDFCCRYFAPANGIDEDPVTGSAFTIMTPYYAAKFGKAEMKARQLSQRGGNVGVKLEGDRVKISGKALTVMRGTLLLPDE